MTPRKELFLKHLAKAIVLLVMGLASPAFAQDIAGSKDHSVISRYPGSVIKWYDVQAFEPYAIAKGPVAGYQGIDDWIEVKGRTTRIYYELDGTKTHMEVFANYEKALIDAGFDIEASGAFAKSSRAADIGSRKWLGAYFKRNEFPPAGIRLLQGSSTSSGSAFVAARKERAAGTVYVAISVTQYSQDIVTTLVDVIEVEDVKTDLVTVNADAIGDAIEEYGRVTLDGLYFDHDKATLTPESKTALEEIVQFLQERPAMTFYVVGHTDATGSYDYNHNLSARRAMAVVQELVEQYGIPSARLEAHGAGPLVPVFSNRSDAGRTKNRRVELVERP